MTWRWPYGAPQRSEMLLRLMCTHSRLIFCYEAPLRLGVPFSVVVSAYEV